VADLDGDGFPDVAVLGENESAFSATVTPFKNVFDAANPAGFVAQPIFDLGAGLSISEPGLNAFAIAAGKFRNAAHNPSGLPDLVLVMPTGIDLLDNNGGFSFSLDSKCVNTSSSGTNCYIGGDSNFPGFPFSSPPRPAVIAADVNGDGVADIVLAIPENCNASDTGGSKSRIYVLIANGDGSFQPAVSMPSPVVNPVALATGNIFGHGAQDLVVTNGGEVCTGTQAETGAITTVGTAVLPNNGAGVFGAAQTIFSQATDILLPSVSSAAVADMNGDGTPDVVISASDGIHVLLNSTTSRGTFTDQGAVPLYGAGDTIQNAAQIDIADFNGDTKLDVAAVIGGIAYIFTGNGTGVLNGPIQGFAGGPNSGQMEAIDANGDGSIDILMSNSTGFSFMPNEELAAGTPAHLVVNAELENPVNFPTVSEPVAGFTLVNGGLAVATNIKVTVTLSAGLIFVSGGLPSFPCSSTSATQVLCALSSLAVEGNSSVIPITVTAATSGTYTMAFSATSDEPEGIPPSDAQFSIMFGVTASPAHLVLGGNLENPVNFPTASQPIVGLTLANGGTDIATNVKITAALPAGVTFISGGTAQGASPAFTCTSVPAAQAVCTTADFPVEANPGVISFEVQAAPGNYTIAFGATSDEAEGTPPSDALFNISVPIAGTVTATALTCAPSPSVFGQTVNCTATVTPTGATGTVTFLDGTKTIGAVTLPNSGTGIALFSSSALTVGTHSITAMYGGNSTDGVSSSPAFTQTVAAGGTSTTVSSSANPSLVGQSVTFTATVASVAPGSGTPTGTVMFLDGANTLGTASLTTNGSVTTATFSTSSLTAASHSITANYGGDTNFATSGSPILTQVVNLKPTTTTLSSSVNPAMVGVSVMLTATVASTATGTPTGNVTFLDGTTSLGTAALSTSGGTTSAALSTSALSAGSHSITATYVGDANFAGSTTSSALTQLVGTVGFGPVAPVTVASGSSVVVNLTVIANPVPSPNFSFILSCTAGVPSNASCINFTGSVAPSVAGTATSFTFLASAPDRLVLVPPSAPSSPNPWTRWVLEFSALLAALLMLVLSSLRRFRRRRLAFCGFLIVLTTIVALTGCTVQLPPATTPGVYNITVSGVSGSTTITTTVNITVTAATGR
jgi:hypothetical protein